MAQKFGLPAAANKKPEPTMQHTYAGVAVAAAPPDTQLLSIPGICDGHELATCGQWSTARLPVGAICKRTWHPAARTCHNSEDGEWRCSTLLPHSSNTRVAWGPARRVYPQGHVHAKLRRHSGQSLVGPPCYPDRLGQQHQQLEDSRRNNLERQGACGNGTVCCLKSQPGPPPQQPLLSS